MAAVRKASLSALFDLGAEDIADLLEQASEDPSKTVRDAAESLTMDAKRSALGHRLSSQVESAGSDGTGFVTTFTASSSIAGAG